MRALSREHFFRYAIVAGIVLFGMFPAHARAADLLLSPDTGTYSVGQEFDVKVQVDPGSDSVNASDGSIIFDKDVLSVSSISKDGSSFSLWTAEPSYSNSAGTVAYSGGTPSAFGNKGTIITIKFKGKSAGTGKVSVSSGSVLAADGKGTDVYKTGGEASFTISADAPKKEEAPADEASSEGDALGPVPLAPNISSPTHPKPDSWYATSTGIFTWNLYPDVVQVRTLLSDQENQTPTAVLKGGATSTQTLTGLKDGVSYYYVQLKNDSGWGAVASRKVQIDTVPPKPFEVALTEGDPPKFTFQTEDELSGIDRYEIILGSSTAATIKAAELKDGAYPVPPQDGGLKTVTIKAYDMAGNSAAATREFTLPKVAKPVKAGEAPPVAQSSIMDKILMIIFALLVGVLAGWIYYSKKNYAEEHVKFVHRLNEISDKNDRVFSAMREEFEQMINDLDPQPQLTPGERQFLENTKEVIDISQEIVETSIEDLKKFVRGV